MANNQTDSAYDTSPVKLFECFNIYFKQMKATGIIVWVPLASDGWKLNSVFIKGVNSKFNEQILGRDEFSLLSTAF